MVPLMQSFRKPHSVHLREAGVNKVVHTCLHNMACKRSSGTTHTIAFIYIYVKFILRWIMLCQFIFKRWFIHLRCFIHLRLMTCVEWHKTSVLMNYKAKFIFNWSICQRILQMCKQINQERHIFNFTLDLNYDVIGLKQLKDLSHLASCSQMDNLSVVKIQPLCTEFIMQWNLY